MRDRNTVSGGSTSVAYFFSYFSRRLEAWLAMWNYIWGSQSNVCLARWSSLPTSKSSGIDVIGTSFEAVTPSMFEEEAKLLFPADVSVERWRRISGLLYIIVVVLLVISSSRSILLIVVIINPKSNTLLCTKFKCLTAAASLLFLNFKWHLCCKRRCDTLCRSVSLGSCFLTGLVFELTVTLLLLLALFKPFEWQRRRVDTDAAPIHCIKAQTVAADASLTCWRHLKSVTSEQESCDLSGTLFNLQMLADSGPQATQPEYGAESCIIVGAPLIITA